MLICLFRISLSFPTHSFSLFQFLQSEGSRVEEKNSNKKSRTLKAIYLQTHHVYSTLNRRGSSRFHVVSTWNTRDAFVGLPLF